MGWGGGSGGQSRSQERPVVATPSSRPPLSAPTLPPHTCRTHYLPAGIRPSTIYYSRYRRYETLSLYILPVEAL